MDTTPAATSSAAPEPENETLGQRIHEKIEEAEHAIVDEAEKLLAGALHAGEEALGIGGASPAPATLGASSMAGTISSGGQSAATSEQSAGNEPANEPEMKSTPAASAPRLTPLDQVAPHTRFEKTKRGFAITLPDGRRIPAATFLEAWAAAFPADALE